MKIVLSAVLLSALAACSQKPIHISETKCTVGPSETVLEGVMSFGFYDAIKPHEGNSATLPPFFIRNAFIQDNIEQLNERNVRVVAKPIEACDLEGGSSEQACTLLGENGTAYLIEEICESE